MAAEMLMEPLPLNWPIFPIVEENKKLSYQNSQKSCQQFGITFVRTFVNKTFIKKHNLVPLAAAQIN